MSTNTNVRIFTILLFITTGAFTQPGPDLNESQASEYTDCEVNFLLKESSSLLRVKEIKTFGNIIYQLPEGWNEQKNSDFLEIYPEEVRQGEVFSIILMSGKVSGSTLEQELEICWNEIANRFGAQMLTQVNGRYYNQDESRKTMAGWEYIAGHGSIRTNHDFFVHAYVIRVNERVERVFVLSQEIALDAIRNNIDPTVHHYPYYKTITNFIFNLRFTNFPSPVLPQPTWNYNGISGVWSGLGFINGGLRTTYVIFYSNGQVFYGAPFPVHGLYKLDTYAERERVSRNWGSYSFKDDKGTVKMSGNTFPIRLENEKLIMAPIDEEHVYVRMPIIHDLRLQGTWHIEDEQNQPVGITFNSDGTFIDNGALRILDHSIYNYYSLADGGGYGHYVINDYTIIFNYQDGRSLLIAFPGMKYEPGNSSPNELILSFNHDVLTKR